MSVPSGSSNGAALAVLAHFAERLLQDEQTTGVRSVSEYRSLYPGWEDEVEVEFARLCGERSDAPADHASALSLAPGQIFGAYRVEAEVGRGGQAVVYRAEDLTLGVPVALKLLSSLSPTALFRFQREGRILARLQHETLCPVYAAGVTDGRPFLAMRYLAGGSLARRIEEWTEQDVARCDWDGHVDRVLELFAPLARGLALAHREGVVHRDLKPGNVLLEEKHGSARLVDFGLARDGYGDEISRTDERFGTPAYMSPEQLAQPSRELNASSDIYSFGLVLYESLALRRAELSENRKLLLRLPIESGRPREGRDRDLLAVLECATELAPSDRYPDMDRLAADLEAVRDRRGVSVRRVGAVRRVQRWARRKPVMALMVALVAGSVAASAVLALLAEKSHSRADAAVAAGDRQRARTLVRSAGDYLSAGDYSAAAEQLQACSASERRFAWQHLDALLDGSLATIAPGLGPIEFAQETATGVIVCGRDRVEVWRGGKRVKGLALQQGTFVDAGAFDERRAFRAVRCRDGLVVEVFDTDGRVERVTLTTGDHPWRFVRPIENGCWLFAATDGVIGRTPGPVELQLLRGSAAALEVSPDGRFASIAVVAHNQLRSETLVIDVQSLQVVSRLPEPDRVVTALTYSSDGRRLLVAAHRPDRMTKAELVVWHVDTETQLLRQAVECREIRALMQLDEPLPSVWVGGEDGTIHRLDAGLEAEDAPLFGHTGAISSFGLGASGLPHTASADGSVKSWRPGGGGAAGTLPISKCRVSALAVGKGGQIWTGSLRDRLRSIDPSGLRPAERFYDLHVGSLAVRANGELAAFSRERWVHFDPRRGVVTAAPGSDRLRGACFGELHGQLPVLFAAAGPPWSDELIAFSWSADSQPTVLAGLSGPVLSVRSDATGVHVLARNGKDVGYWRAPGREPVLVSRAASARGGVARSVDVSPDGRYLAIGRERAIELRSTNAVAEVVLHPIKAPARAIRFSPDSKSLAYSIESEVVLAEVPHPVPLLSLGDLSKPVRCLAWSPDGRTLVAGARYEPLRVWRAFAPRIGSGADRRQVGAWAREIPSVRADAWLLNTEAWRSPLLRSRLGPWHVLQQPFGDRHWYECVSRAAVERGVKWWVSAARFRLGDVAAARDGLTAHVREAKGGSHDLYSKPLAFLSMAHALSGDSDAARSTLEMACAASNPDELLLAEARSRIEPEFAMVIPWLEAHVRSGTVSADWEQQLERSELGQAARAQVCRIVDLLPDGEDMTHLFAWSCALQPGRAKQDFEAAAAWARRAFAMQPTSRMQLAAAACAMRAGEPVMAELQVIAERERARQRDGNPAAFAFLALAQRSAGRIGAAELSYSRFVVLGSQRRYRGDRAVSVLREELAAVFGQ